MNESANSKREGSASASPALSSEAADLLRVLYSAALDEEQWLQFVAAARAAFRAGSAGFLLIHEASATSELSYAEGVSEQDRIRYRDTYQAINPRLAVMRGLGVGEWFFCHEHFDDAFVAKDRYYQEFALPSGYRYALTGVVARREGQIITFGFWRQADAGPFTAHEKALARSLSPHLEGVANFHLQSARAAAESAYRAALSDAGEGAAWMVAADGHVLARNQRAGAMIDGVGRHALAERGDKLVSAERRFASGFAAALTRCGDAPIKDGADAAEEGSGVPGVQVTAWTKPHSPWLVREQRPAALVRMAATLAAVDLNQAARRFKLSAAECAVAASLCTGMSLAEIAVERGVARSTVKSQVESLFIKTETRSQKALVTKLLKS